MIFNKSVQQLPASRQIGLKVGKNLKEFKIYFPHFVSVPRTLSANPPLGQRLH